jgi:hypothetical protein
MRYSWISGSFMRRKLEGGSSKEEAGRINRNSASWFEAGSSKLEVKFVIECSVFGVRNLRRLFRKAKYGESTDSASWFEAGSSKPEGGSWK